MYNSETNIKIDLIIKDSKSKNNVETIFKLINIIFKEENFSVVENIKINPNNFLEFLRKRNKISTLLYKTIKYSEIYLRYKSLDEIIELLNKSIIEHKHKELPNFNTLLNNYLVSLYLYENKTELNNFYDTFLRSKFSEYSYKDKLDFIEDLNPFKVNIDDFKYLKLYYRIDGKSIKEEEKSIQLQKLEDFDEILNYHIINDQNLNIFFKDMDFYKIMSDKAFITLNLNNISCNFAENNLLIKKIKVDNINNEFKIIDYSLNSFIDIILKETYKKNKIKDGYIYLFLELPKEIKINEIEIMIIGEKDEKRI